MAHRHVLAYFFCAFALVIGQSPQYALKGREVKLKPAIPEHPDDILWKHKGHKAVEYDGMEQMVFGNYENRVTLDWSTAELTITHLTYEDSGDYELEITKGRIVHRSNHKLEVMDKVAKPTISCEMIDGSGSDKLGIQATLMCSAEPSHPQSLMKLEWSSRPGQPVQPGPNITISLGDGYDDEEYSCSVSNPLSNERATFIAKDCYPDKSSSTGLIIGLVILFSIIALLLFLGFIFRRKLAKACCEKGKRGDLEQSPGERRMEGSDNKASEIEENQPFLDRAPTLPSKQLLRSLVQTEPNDSASEHKEAKYSDPDTEKAQEVSDWLTKKGSVMEIRKRFEADNGGQIFPSKFPADTQKGKNADKPLFSPGPEPPSHLDVNTEPVHHASKDKEADADVVREPTENEPPQCDLSNSEEANKPDYSEDMQCDVQSPTSPKQTEPEKEADEDEEEKSVPASGVPPPSPQPRPSLIQSSPHMSPEDITVNLKEDSNSDQVTGETAEKNHMESNSADDSSEEEQSSTISDQKGSETTAHEQDSHLAQGETDKREDNQQETDKPVSEDEKESDGVGDQESIDKAQNQSVATSQQPQTATLTTPDNSNTNTCQESLDTAQAEPEQENKTTHDSDESERQPDSSTAEKYKSYVMKVKERFEANNGGQTTPKRPPADTRKEPEKEADEDEEEKSVPASGVPPSSPQPHPPLTQSSPHMSPEDITVNLKEDSNSDQVTGETAEKNHMESNSAEESDGVGDQESIDKAQNQSVATSQQPQSATLTTPDNTRQQ
ncbi:lymphocyte function-associated antigen 3 [Thunnus maccoyii]|uniref:lymphocyte function-associated antigen 3 n=1 Tax=Thunnus maccoyii TaxID=8240 RepID=UPI001C4BAB2D|nr:lymphocyte function-associated antigen 3 [Thunnus maccoyii]